MRDVGRERAGRIHEKLSRELGPAISKWLGEEDILDILLNPDGKLWVERLGHDPQCLGHMVPEQAEALIATLAAETGTVITAGRPILECTLPLDGSRFSAVIPPVAEAPVFAIRRRASRVFALQDYVQARIMTARQADILTGAIRARRNILIAGGTGSGKTTLANAVIRAMSDHAPTERLIILEDTAELICTADNAVIMRTCKSVDLQMLLRTTLRLSPRRIIVGEVRGGEALEMLKAWNTGHPGGLATIHANSAMDALARLEDLLREATAAPMQRTIAAAIHLIVFITRTPSGRTIGECLHIGGFDGGRYLTNLKDNNNA